MGADSGLESKVYELSHFNIDIYQENKVAIRKINLPDDIQQCTKVNLKGTEYIKGHALIIRQDGYEENITIGRICLLLCSIEMQVYAVFEVIESSFIPSLRAYELERKIGYECLSLHEVMDFKPMHIYNLGNMLCIKPCYGFVSHYF